MTDELIYDTAQLIKDARHRPAGRRASTAARARRPEQMFKTLAHGRRDPSRRSARPTSSTRSRRPSCTTSAVELGYLDAEGEEKVRQGISGYHHESILKHPHKELAETLAKITPVYAKSPEFLKPRCAGSSSIA